MKVLVEGSHEPSSIKLSETAKELQMETTTLLTKICTKCKIEKSINEFGKRKASYDGLMFQCRSCRKIVCDAYKINNKDKINHYNHTNKKKIQEQRRIYTENNKDSKKAYDKKYKLENKDRIQKFQKEYYAKHKSKMNEHSKDYRLNNKIKTMEYQRNYAIANRLKLKNYKRCYQIENIHKIRLHRASVGYKLMKRAVDSKRRKQLTIEANGSVTKVSLNALLMDQDSKCFYCNCLLDFNIKRSVHLDHYIPLSKGGTHSIDNVVWSCASCNLTKGSKIYDIRE